MNQYFNDMWLNLEEELSSYDTFINDNEWMSQTTSPENSESVNPEKNLDTPNLSIETYEDLLSSNREGPSMSELRSQNRGDRIKAVREFYNQAPTIINAESITRLKTIADNLYRFGKVKQANSMMDKINSAFENSIWVEQTPTGEKSLTITKEAGIVEARVLIEESDSNFVVDIEKTFDNVLDAIGFYLNPNQDDQ